MADVRDIHERGSLQHGLVSRADLRALGRSPKQVRSLVAAGTLLPLGRRTFALGGLPMNPKRRAMAACIEAEGVACRGTAAWLHGISGFGSGCPPEVVVPNSRSSYSSPIVRVHSSTWLPTDDLVHVDAIPCLNVARTLFSLAGAVPGISAERFVSALEEAVRDGKASDKWLWWLLDRTRRRGRNGVSVFAAVLAERDGGMATESWLERELVRVLRSAGLPLPACQRRIEREGAFVARVDFVYQPQRIVIEVSGHRFHSSRGQLAADARRRNELELAGFHVIEFTYDDLVRDPAYVVAMVRQALAGARPDTAA